MSPDQKATRPFKKLIRKELYNIFIKQAYPMSSLQMSSSSTNTLVSLIRASRGLTAPSNPLFFAIEWSTSGMIPLMRNIWHVTST